MRQLKSLLILCVLFMFSGLQMELKASHAMGADMSYECLGANQFRITLKFYRDCNGVEAPDFIPLVENGGQCSNPPLSVTLSLESGYPQIVTPICASEPDACNGNGTYGIEEYVYSGVVTLPPAGSCPRAIFGYRLCCRNGAITTLNQASSQNIYIETEIDRNNYPCNSSPVFTNSPTPYTCVNEPISFNHGAVDAENDSLVFSLVNCQQTNGGGVNYAGGFNGTNSPLTTASGSVSINSTTGTISFTPTAIQVAVICVRVEEYRDGIKIGETIRDMQFTVISCPNILPIASGVDGTASNSGSSGSYSVDICEGEYICFDIETYDGNSDIINMAWNNGIPSGSFSVSGQNTTSPSATFCWATNEGDVGSNFFTVTLVDEACPLEGTNIFSYEVNVFANPNPPVNIQTDATICPGESVNLTSNASPAGGNVLQWAPSTNISSTTTTNTTVFPNQTTIYSLSVSYPDGCTDTDVVEITVEPNPPVSLNSQYIVTCPGQTVTLIATAAVDPSDLGTVSWIANPGGAATSLGSGTISGTSSSIDVTPTTVTEYQVTMENGLGCSTTTSVLVDVTSPPPLNACNLIYVDDVNSVAAGTPTDPTGLLDALDRSLCNNTVLKLATGTYNIDNAINLPSYATIEGGFDAGDNWKKTSLKGATTINRTAANIEDQMGISPRLVAMYGDFATGFRLQDLTITTDDAPEDVDYNNNAISTYGIHLDNCEDYEIIRTCIEVGAAEPGVLGDPGFDGETASDGADGTNGSSDNENNEGIGGAGGDGAVLAACNIPGFNGAGGTGCPQGPCCNAGCNGGTGSPSLYNCGSGGGGGGGGGEEDRNGGMAGGGGSVSAGFGNFPIPQHNQFNAYATSGPCRNSGNGFGQANGCGENIVLGSNESGRCGVDGTDGASGPAGGVGPAGTHTGLFFVPGAAGAAGSPGQGGQGGAGGGGGAGEGGTLCDNGAGAGGGGGGGGGNGGLGGNGGKGGGSSYGIYIVNSATGTISQSSISAGPAGAGGAGGAGGIGGAGGAGGNGGVANGDVGFGGNGGDGGNGGQGGQGGAGAAGESLAIYGTSPSYSMFDLASQPVIGADDLSCTNSDITFCGPSSGNWTFGSNSIPTSASGLNVVTQFTDIDRHDITFGGDLYEGFFYVGFDGERKPEISTSANQVTGTVDSFYLCEGDIATFFTTQIADSFHWDFNGAITNPSTSEDLVTETFGTAGEYWVELYVRTLCCGDSPIDSIRLFVDPIMNYVDDQVDVGICEGEIVNLSLNQALANISIDSVVWTPSTNLNVVDVLTASVAPLSNITYTATLYSATYSGEYVCSDELDFVVTVTEVPELVAFFPNQATIICESTGTTTATLIMTGSGALSYEWSHDPSETGFSTVVGAGSYTVTVTDISGGCSATVEKDIELTISAPYLGVTDLVNLDCPGDMSGSTTVQLYNTSGGDSYVWSNSATGPTIGGLAPGVYTVTATTDLGGGALCDIIEEVEVFSPEPLMVTGTPDDASCGNDGGVSLDFPTGGIPPYMYNWSNSTINMPLTGVGVGTYTVTVTDDNSCTTTQSYMIGLDASPDVEFIRE